MRTYVRDGSRDYRIVDRWPRFRDDTSERDDDATLASTDARFERAGDERPLRDCEGFGWVAYPDEPGRRVSHAVRGADDGVWVFDPLDAPGIDERIAALGDVAGVVVCADYHARDAGAFARRHDVPVSVPTWLDRVAGRVDAPVERIADGIAGFELRRLRPLWAWHEVVAFRPSDGTLYVPDFLTTQETFRVDGERVGMPTVSRLRPPVDAFADWSPERVLLGHGEGVFEDATPALDDALANARSRFPRALVSNLPGEARSMLDALR
jgi:hypothetical protein